MKIENVKNIIPYILKWAESQTPKNDIYWEFSSGDDEWFPFDFKNMIDWEQATKYYISILECEPFRGNYDSDEEHSYKMMYVNGRFVCLRFKVGDRTDAQFFWNGDVRKGIMAELLQRFPVISDDHVTLLNEETSKKISNSQYMSFVEIDGELFQFNHCPSWGFLVGNGKQILMTKGESGELEVYGDVVDVKTRFQNQKYVFGKVEYHMKSGEVISANTYDEKDKWFLFKKVEI